MLLFLLPSSLLTPLEFLKIVLLKCIQASDIIGDAQTFEVFLIFLSKKQQKNKT